MDRIFNVLTLLCAVLLTITTPARAAPIVVQASLNPFCGVSTSCRLRPISSAVGTGAPVDGMIFNLKLDDMMHIEADAVTRILILYTVAITDVMGGATWLFSATAALSDENGNMITPEFDLGGLGGIDTCCNLPPTQYDNSIPSTFPTDFIIPNVLFHGINFRMSTTRFDGNGTWTVAIDRVIIQGTGLEIVTASVSDLIATKTNNVSSTTLTAGTPFNWNIVVENNGIGDAQFNHATVILRDNLPTGAVYEKPTVHNSMHITNAANIDCGINDRDLNCTANGANVIIGGSGGLGRGSFEVMVAVTPTETGQLENPRRDAVCRVDPNNNLAESDKTNNDCADTVMIVNAVNIPLLDFWSLALLAGLLGFAATIYHRAL